MAKILVIQNKKPKRDATMKRKNITLDHPERFAKVPEIPKEKLDKAIAQACERLKKMGEKHGEDFPSCWSIDFKYDYKHNRNWVGGMYAGCYWLAYQLTGNHWFKTMAEKLTDTLRTNVNDALALRTFALSVAIKK